MARCKHTGRQISEVPASDELPSAALQQPVVRCELRLSPWLLDNGKRAGTEGKRGRKIRETEGVDYSSNEAAGVREKCRRQSADGIDILGGSRRGERNST